MNNDKKELDEIGQILEDFKSKKETAQNISKEKKPSDHKDFKGSMVALKNNIIKFFKSNTFKYIIIAIITIAILVGIVFAVIHAVNYKRTSIEKEYGVTIPQNVISEYYEDYAKNADFSGHLKIKDSSIDGDVYKAKSNSYYTTHSGTKSKNIAGAFYLDSKDQIGENSTSKILTIYGSADLFSDLENMYSTTEEYKKYPVIEFNTLYEKSSYIITGVFYTNTNPNDDLGYVFPYSTPNMTVDSFLTFRERLEARFVYSTERKIKKDDNLLILSTTSNLFKGAEFVVVAVKSDSTNIDVNNTSISELPHYPQIWFDNNKKTNPYRFTSKWYPTVYTNSAETETTILTANDYK